ncbi:Integrase/recombinase [Halomicronema hongdechloris C2206]|uniref:Integrase/recombinase n=1 Tax=Halomicronema hongdechloris C2206 TaxID=1641165 RepID=A0A1Z3HLT8_9CYAN|nr:phage integrase N-terminal SAM-like domain-containing protein [Halomicronema hongdechloris]ASC71260.1 Integrase/recombinase [Halomicronema hongdechloris C2206]
MEPPRPKKLLDQVREAIRLKHYSYRTEQTYVQWIRRYPNGARLRIGLIAP